MVLKSKSLAQPSWNAIVWRYMGVDKFFDLIRNEHIVFNRADNFSDKNELLFHWVEQKRQSITGPEEDSEFLLRCNQLKESTFVSSWSAQRTESFGLWKVYLGGNNPGVAIKTNYKNLMNSIHSLDYKIFSGKVKYYEPTREKSSDYIEHLDDDQLIGTKYAGYSYEQEVRLFFRPERLNSRTQKVIAVPVDLSSLVQEIYLSPWVASWFQDTFNEIVDKLRPSITPKIVNSRINDNG